MSGGGDGQVGRAGPSQLGGLACGEWGSLFPLEASPAWAGAHCPCFSLPAPPGPRLPRAPPPGIHFPVASPGPRNCKELLTRGHFLSGWHTIYMPDCQPLTVLCDMDMDGGGWTVSTGTSGTAVWSLGTPQTRLCARGRAVSGGLSLL